MAASAIGSLNAVLDCETVATFAAAGLDYQSTSCGTHSGAKTGGSFSFTAGSVQGLLCHFDFSRLVTLLLINIHNLQLYHRVVQFINNFKLIISVCGKIPETRFLFLIFRIPT
jgi:hypothetical protein